MSYRDGESSITPLPEMNRTDADVNLIAVWSNAIVYENPVNDPLFAAHRLEMRAQSSGTDKALYWADHYAGVIGCAEQVRNHPTLYKSPDY